MTNSLGWRCWSMCWSYIVRRWCQKLRTVTVIKIIITQVPSPSSAATWLSYSGKLWTFMASSHLWHKKICPPSPAMYNILYTHHQGSLGPRLLPWRLVRGTTGGSCQVEEEKPAGVQVDGRWWKQFDLKRQVWQNSVLMKVSVQFSTYHMVWILKVKPDGWGSLVENTFGSFRILCRWTTLLLKSTPQQLLK